MHSAKIGEKTSPPQIRWVKAKIRERRYQISEHVIRFLMARLLTLPEIEAAIETGEVIGIQKPSLRMGSTLIRGTVNGKTALIRTARGTDECLIISLAYLTTHPHWTELTYTKHNQRHHMENPFGTCFFCGGDIKAITVGNFDYRLEGKLFVIKDTPAGLCLQCGEKYLTAETAKNINALIEAGRFTDTEEVRVMAFAQDE